MRNFNLSLPISLVLLLSGAPINPVQGSDRVAFVIGNGAYVHAPRLDNPVNDARAVANLLGQLGFKVIEVEDAGVDRFYDGLEQFKTAASGARVGLFYFAGHGVEVEGSNYLIPVDAELSQESHLRTQTVSLNTVLDEMDSLRLPAKLLILDCCRDNPVTRSWARTRSAARGLAEITDQDLPDATMILFAAGPGQAALDGSNGNSPFTSALLKELAKPDRNALESFFAISDSVVATTGERQEPWVKMDGAGRAFREFNFAAGPRVKTPPPPLGVPVPSNPGPPELLKNGGFEEGFADWGSGEIETMLANRGERMPPFWASFVGDFTTSTSGTIDQGVFHTGTSSLRIDHVTPAGANLYGTICQQVGGLESGATYRLSGWSCGMKVTIVGDGAWARRGATATGEDWQPFTFDFSPNPVSHIDYRIISESPGTVWLDDLSLKLLPPESSGSGR